MEQKATFFSWLSENWGAVVALATLATTLPFSAFKLKHDILSVKPICDINPGDYEDRLFVQIRNVGIGPMVITKFWCKNDVREYEAIIQMFNDEGITWTTFYETLDGKTIPAGKMCMLIEIRNPSLPEKYQIRKRLSEVTVYVEYANIYGKKFKCKKSLDFFGRTLVDSVNNQED